MFQMSACHEILQASYSKFIVEDSQKNHTWLTAFQDQIASITHNTSGNSTSEKMLAAPKLKFFVSSNNTVKSIAEL